MGRGAADSLGSFEGYVAAAAHNARSSYLRRKYPERARLRDRLRYMLSHHEQRAVWELERREWLCGFVSWRDQQLSRRSSDRLQLLPSDPCSISHFSGRVT
jgi:hypothetical protein